MEGKKKRRCEKLDFFFVYKKKTVYRHISSLTRKFLRKDDVIINT